MYSREERTKAIELYIKYDRCAADVARELGYPDRKSLVRSSAPSNGDQMNYQKVCRTVFATN